MCETHIVPKQFNITTVNETTVKFSEMRIPR